MMRSGIPRGVVSRPTQRSGSGSKLAGLEETHAELSMPLGLNQPGLLGRGSIYDAAGLCLGEAAGRQGRSGLSEPISSLT